MREKCYTHVHKVPVGAFVGARVGARVGAPNVSWSESVHNIDDLWGATRTEDV